MLVLRNRACYHRLADEFEAAVYIAPGSEECLLSRQDTFAVTSTHKRDNYRTYHLEPWVTALLLSTLQIPNPVNLKVRQLCPTAGCCNADHYERLPCVPGGSNSTSRISRLHTARTPEELFPPALLKPLNPHGYAMSGARNKRTLISDEQAAYILRQRYIAKRSYQDIAAEVGRPVRTIVGICSGHSHRRTAQAILDELIAGALGAPEDERVCAAAR